MSGLKQFFQPKTLLYSSSLIEKKLKGVFFRFIIYLSRNLSGFRLSNFFVNCFYFQHNLSFFFVFSQINGEL
jgi:hypothetical protein